MGPRFESVKVHQWPVGQVVKTEASHAFNIGSNPVRVTSFSHMTLSQKTRKRIFLRVLWLVATKSNPLRWALIWKENEEAESRSKHVKYKIHLTKAPKGAKLQQLEPEKVLT